MWCLGILCYLVSKAAFVTSWEANQRNVSPPFCSSSCFLTRREEVGPSVIIIKHSEKKGQNLGE